MKNINKSHKWSDERKRKHSKIMSGEGNGRWKGGKQIRKGYVYIYNKSHPSATKEGYVLEHRLIMEKKLGRLLMRREVVHHINGISTDNRIENLSLLNISTHPILHNKGRVSNRKGIVMSEEQKEKIRLALTGKPKRKRTEYQWT